MRNHRSFWLLLEVFGLLGIISGTSSIAGPQFLTLPFSNPNVFVRQGWLYDRSGHFSCADFPAAVAGRCHKGIDYFCVENDTVKSFDILAAAPGRAIATSSFSGGYGYFVYVAHGEVDESGVPLFTLYAHLEEDSWTVPVKNLAQFREDVLSMDFSDWKPVDRGQLIGKAGKTGLANQIHLHFEVQRDRYPLHKTDPYRIYGTVDYYPAPCTPAPLLPDELTSRTPSSMWTVCPPVPPQKRFIIQPGPETGKDIWTTSVFSYAPGGSLPGGGLENHELVIGGWGDLYHSLLQFDLNGLPQAARSAHLELFCFTQRGFGTTAMVADRITQFWDWKTQGTGRDRLRLWWVDRPAAMQITAGVLLPPILGEWYSIDITELFNGWQNGVYPNFGLQLRPSPGGNNHWAEFYSSDHIEDPALRPRLVIEY